MQPGPTDSEDPLATGSVLTAVTSGRAPQQRPFVRFAAFMAALCVVNVIVSASFPLGGEEAYYWTWSRRLELSYYDHPPMVAWLIRLATEVFGNSVLAIRAAGLVLGCVTATAAYGIAHNVFRDGRIAMWSGCIVAVTAFFAATRTVMVPDGPLFAAWAVSLWCVTRALQPGRERWWLGAGVALALGALSKFHAVLLPVAIALFLLFSSRYRRLLRTPWPYAAAVVAGLGTVPILVWNADNGWITFYYQLSGRHSEPGRFGVYLLEMLFAPLGYIGPLLYPMCLGGAVWGLRRGLAAGGDARALLAFACLVPFVGFLILSPFMRIDPQWAAAGFLSGGVLAAAYGVELATRGRRFVTRRALMIGTGLNAVLLTLAAAGALIVYHFPGVVPHEIQILDYRQQLNTSRLVKLWGWNELGQRVRRELDAMPGDPPPFLFFDRNHGTAANIVFHTPGHPDVYMSGDSPKKGYQYYFWRQRDPIAGRDALLISVWFSDDTMARLKAAFESVDELEPLTGVSTPNGRQWFQMYRGRNLKHPELMW